MPRHPAGGLLRLKPALEARLGPVQREALLCSYAAAAMMGGKNDVAKEAVRWAPFYSHSCEGVAIRVGNGCQFGLPCCPARTPVPRRRSGVHGL